jgi:hypothetical protein
MFDNRNACFIRPVTGLSVALGSLTKANTRTTVAGGGKAGAPQQSFYVGVLPTLGQWWGNEKNTPVPKNLETGVMTRAGEGT